MCMRSPKSMGVQDMYSTWAYKKDRASGADRIHSQPSGPAGAQIGPTTLGMPPDFPQDSVRVVTFKAMGDHTEIHIVKHGFASDHMLNLAKMGLEQCLNKMAAIFSNP